MEPGQRSLILKSKKKVRWIDAGEVSALRSQAIYHALAYARNEESPDTIVFVRPAEPYVCIGYHQDARKELDLNHCRSFQLPVIRRETGGGTVFIDNMQLFVQWIFAPEHLPRRAGTRFQYFIKPIVETHRQFGIKAAFHPPNDVHVNGRKLVGTGAAAIGNAEVVTGNFILGFDFDRMVGVLNVPGECFRRMFADSLEKYFSNLGRELGAAPPAAEIRNAYLEHCKAVLQRPIGKGYFTEEEEQWIQRIEQKFTADEWVFPEGKTAEVPARRLVKVHADVWVGQCTWRSKSGGELTAVVRLRGKRIDAIRFCESVEMDPPYKLEAFEKMLKHTPFEREAIEETTKVFFELHSVRSENLIPEEFANALVKLKSLTAAAPFSI